MAAAQTYEPIATYTVPSATGSYTFNSIPSTYTDLILISSGTNDTSSQSYRLRFNSDTGTNYSFTYFYGEGTNTPTGRSTNQTGIGAMGRAGYGSAVGSSVIQIQNYSNSTTYKTVIGRGGNGNELTIVAVGLWRSTSAINSVYIAPESSGNINSGTTFTLYGILAA